MKQIGLHICIAKSLHNRVILYPLLGCFALIELEGELHIKMSSATQYSAMQAMLVQILHLNKPPIASLLDGNWINRCVTDIASEDSEAFDTRGASVLWVLPKALHRQNPELITNYMKAYATAFTQNFSWRVGWT